MFKDAWGAINHTWASACIVSVLWWDSTLSGSGCYWVFKELGVLCEYRLSQFGRVVKAWDLKSHGVTRAGSNPAADDLFLPTQFSSYHSGKVQLFYLWGGWLLAFRSSWARGLLGKWGVPAFLHVVRAYACLAQGFFVASLSDFYHCGRHFGRMFWLSLRLIFSVAKALLPRQLLLLSN